MDDAEQDEIDFYNVNIKPVINGVLHDLDVLDALIDNFATMPSEVGCTDVGQAESDMKEWLIKTERDPVHHKCEHCNMTFKRKESYRRHISTCRSCAAIRIAKGIPVWLDLHRCGVCGEDFTTEHTLLTHMARYHT